MIRKIGYRGYHVLIKQRAVFGQPGESIYTAFGMNGRKEILLDSNGERIELCQGTDLKQVLTSARRILVDYLQISAKTRRHATKAFKDKT